MLSIQVRRSFLCMKINTCLISKHTMLSIGTNDSVNRQEVDGAEKERKKSIT